MIDSSERTFPTRIDRWLIVVLALSLGGGLAAILLAAAEDPREAWIGGVVFIVTMALVMVIAVPTRYKITDAELLIRSGVIRYRVPLESIRRVYPTHNPLSAPAWSLDRLGIEYYRGKSRSLALISPAHQDEFLEVLRERAGLAVAGRELRRHDPPAR